jgi:imidazolonepropionase-like amidohydrolase
MAAESLGMGYKIGTIAEGMQADLVAIGGDPIANVENMRKVTFVMKGGKVVRWP